MTCAPDFRPYFYLDRIRPRTRHVYLLKVTGSGLTMPWMRRTWKQPIIWR